MQGIKGLCIVGVVLSAFMTGGQSGCEQCDDGDGNGICDHQESRTVDFAGYTWTVKAGLDLGPGPNDWSGSENNVWLDDDGLHLAITQTGANWYCAEVYLTEALGFGRYTFRLKGAVDHLDPMVIAAPFLYRDDVNELDIEFARWGDAEDETNAQYVVQPYFRDGHLMRYAFDLGGEEVSTHVIDWTPERVVFTSAPGLDPDGPEAYSWTFDDVSAIPGEEGMDVHLNLWLYQGEAPSDGQGVEIVMTDFNFEGA